MTELTTSFVGGKSITTTTTNVKCNQRQVFLILFNAHSRASLPLCMSKLNHGTNIQLMHTLQNENILFSETLQ